MASKFAFERAIVGNLAREPVPWFERSIMFPRELRTDFHKITQSKIIEDEPPVIHK